MFWLIFTIIVLTLAYYGEERHIKGRNTYIYVRIGLVAVLAFAIAMCGNGADREQYMRLYDSNFIDNRFFSIKEWLSLASSDVELGFIAICKICDILGLSSVGMLLVVSVLTNALVVNTFYRFRNPIMVFFLYILSMYFLQQTNLVRQTLAVSIGLYSLRYIESEKWIKYLIGVFLAFIIHKSSIILILFTPFCFHELINEKILNRVLGVLWGLSILVAFHIISGDYLPLEILADTRYEKFTTGYDTLGVHKQVFDITMNASVLFYFAFGKVIKEKQIYAVFFVLSCVITNISVAMLFIQRMTYYFAPIFCAYLPALLYENTLVEKGKGGKMDYKILITLTALWFGRGLLSRLSGDFEQIGGHIESFGSIFR